MALAKAQWLDEFAAFAGELHPSDKECSLILNVVPFASVTGLLELPSAVPATAP
jgi:hypothetical protein